MNLDSAVITETERIDEWATQDSTVREREREETRSTREQEMQREKRILYAIQIFTATGEKRNLDRDADLLSRGDEDEERKTFE